MGFGVVKRLALLVVVVLSSLSVVATASADEGSGGYTSFDISWPQCPSNLPDQRFEFAIIGINGGRPFTSNPCFVTQYKWARAAESNPDVYINVDFPRPTLVEAMSGPYGRCAEDDHWCRGYNWGYNLAANSVARAKAYGITPGRYWLDVETDNYWSSSTRNNSQVVRGAIDWFLANNVPIGIYSTYYQWGLITGNYMPQAKLPLWVAGATSAEMAAERCNQSRFTFAGGETWLVQYVRTYDQNHACQPLVEAKTAQNARQPQPAIQTTPTASPPAAVTPAPTPTAQAPAQAAPAGKSAAPSNQPAASPFTAMMDALRGTFFTGSGK